MLLRMEQHKKRLSFATRSAKAWQNYFDLHGILPGITLSPEQIQVVQQDDKHLLINGSAGSGKSITLLYKLFKVMEQEHEGKRILYCSFNNTLIQDARKRRDQSTKYYDLKEKHTLHMHTFHYMAFHLLKEIGLTRAEHMLTSQAEIKRHEENMLRRTMILVEKYMNSNEHMQLPQSQRLFKTHGGSFLMEEILWMKANGFITEELYLNCERVGRGSNPRLTKEQRQTIYFLYKEYHKLLEQKFHGTLDLEDYALLLLKYMDQIPETLKYDHILVDEVQDLQPMQIKALVKLAKGSIVLSGDPKQRIYKRNPFSYKELGLDIEGRKNRKLNINYRSTKQIMNLASTIEFLDTENDREDDQKFVREGPMPEIRHYKELSGLNRFLISEIKELRVTKPGASVAIIHRYDGDQDKLFKSNIRLALSREFDLITTEQYGKRFDHSKERKPIFFTDAFSVKGLEFDYVYILHFDRNHYPNKKRIEELDNRTSGDRSSTTYMADEDMIRNDEKKILYVALTRAKEKVCLLYSGEKESNISSFVRDFYAKDYKSYGFTKTKFSK